MMNSRIIGHAELDLQRLQVDIDRILGAVPPAQDYSEYRFGSFYTYILRSPKGKDGDGLFRGADGLAQHTALGASLDYLNSVIDRTFDTGKLQMLRAYLLQDALLIPHCDYVEFKEEAKRMARFHLPVLTNAKSLHSEEDTVFHMRVGEVWYLDVTQIHAACNASSAPRVSLVLDFLLDGAPLESIFRQPALAGQGTPEIIQRPPLEPGFDDSVRAMGRLLSEDNFRDITQLLSRVHFYRDAPAGQFFEWLSDACRVSKRPELIDKAGRLREFLVRSRELGQRFAL